MRYFNILFYLASAFIISTTIFIYLFSGSSDINLASPSIERVINPGFNLWFPKEVLGTQSINPEISAKAALFVEANSGDILYEKNIHQKLPIASLVKIMTTLVALEHKSMEDNFRVSANAASQEPDKMLLIKDEELSLRELLYGIFLISANDAAEVVAEGTYGDREEFIKEMNRKTGQLGMKESYYVNPTGLDEDGGNSYSSAYDLALLTRHLIKRFPEVVEISKVEHIILPITEKHQDYDLYSGINLLTTYPGVVGFKTGYTPNAGYTLVTLARKNGKEVVGVLLDSQYRRDEARVLLDYSFKKLGV